MPVSFCPGSADTSRVVFRKLYKVSQYDRRGSPRFVAVGTRDAFNAIQTDPQLTNRFEPELLRRWTMTDDYLRLLASFEIAFPLARPRSS
jgi:hypothetical protein